MSGKGEDSLRNVLSGEAHARVIQAKDIGSVQINLTPRSRRVPRGLPRAPLRPINRDRELELLDKMLEEEVSTKSGLVVC